MPASCVTLLGIALLVTSATCLFAFRDNPIAALIALAFHGTAMSGLLVLHARLLRGVRDQLSEDQREVS